VESGRNPATHIDRIREVISKLEQFKPDLALIVRLRFYGGLTVDEVAEFLAMSKRDVERDWTFIKDWIKKEFASQEKPR
jgi:DNA-directed RNA polymerase specialized sigma24 family protein